MKNENSTTEPQLTKVTDTPEPLVTSSRRKVKPTTSGSSTAGCPPGKMWKRGKLVDIPEALDPQKKANLRKGWSNIVKGREALKAKRAAVKAVREKAAAGQPLTPQELSLATWRAGGVPRTSDRDRRSSYEKERDELNSMAKIMVKSATVQELRLKVEAVATKLGYDPLEELIRMVQNDDLKAEERISIHKTLLPFLVPTMPPIPKESLEVDSKKVRVVVQQLHFAPEIQKGDDLFKERPKTVDIEVMTPESPLP